MTIRARPTVSGLLTEKLILEDRVDLLLGPYSSVLTLAAADVAEASQRVLWNHGGSSDKICSQGYRWVVGILTPASKYLLGVIDLVKETDPTARRVAILHSGGGSFPAAVASGVASYAAREGFQVIFKRSYDPSTDDFSPLLTEVMDSGADVVLGVGRIGDDLLLARHIVEKGVRAVAIGLVAAGIGRFGEELGRWANGFLGPSQWEPGAAYSPDYGPSAQELARRHESFQPGKGDYAMAQAYAGGLVAQRCVEEAGTLDNHVLRETADGLDFSTFYGRFKLDMATGCQAGRSVVIVQWQGGKKVVVWPRELRQAELMYPSHTGGIS